jgi:epoxyqueuosine reductase
LDLKEELRKEAFKNEFSLFGVPKIEEVEKIPFPAHRGLVKPSEVMPEAKSVIILGFHIWDIAMNSVVASTIPADKIPFDLVEGAVYYNMYYEIVEARAWRVCKYLWDQEYKAVPANFIHLKPAAMLAGLGFIGKMTLVLTPQYGPRQRWAAILTDAYIKPDDPWKFVQGGEGDLCKDCEICIKACPTHAIIPGYSQGVEAGKKVDMSKCIVPQELFDKPSQESKPHFRYISPRGLFECTICHDSCPVGRQNSLKKAAEWRQTPLKP